MLFSLACHKVPQTEQKTAPHLSVNSLEGSLTTLLIAHVATLQSGRQLEFYVTLLGVFFIARNLVLFRVQKNGNLEMETNSIPSPLSHILFTATLEDYPSLMLATLGGFLQQV